MSVISAGNTTTTTLTQTGDTSGNLVFTTGGANTVALTLTNAQVANFANPPQVGGNTAINGPAFSVYASAGQTISSVTFTKIQLNTKVFDTATCFDNTTNYRFTPNVAGYYQIQGTIYYNGSVATGDIQATIYKNGSSYATCYGGYTGGNGHAGATVSTLIYMNGSTDYVELWTYQSTGGSSQPTVGGATTTYMSGAMVRGA